MKPPFELPIWIDNDTTLVAADCELICDTEAATEKELEYIVAASNNHPHLIKMIEDQGDARN